MSDTLISSTGEDLVVKVPKVEAVRPFGSKLLVEIINAKEMMNTDLVLPEDVSGDGAPQAYIIELGPNVDESLNLKVGQRIYWSGKGTHVEDPRQTKRMRALLEVHNVLAIIEEEACE